MAVSDREPNFITGFHTLRTLIGGLGFALPLVLWAHTALTTGGWKPLTSISAYYHTPMRDVLVAGVCVIGVFMLCYRGYRHGRILPDKWIARACGLAAMCVALMPTDGATDDAATGIIGDTQMAPYRQELHAFSAAVFLLIAAYFCIGLFTKSEDGASPCLRKRRRNCIYAACGFIILTALAVMIFATIEELRTGNGELFADARLYFFAETAALWAFGLAWIVKGRVLYLRARQMLAALRGGAGS